MIQRTVEDVVTLQRPGAPATGVAAARARVTSGEADAVVMVWDGGERYVLGAETDTILVRASALYDVEEALAAEIRGERKGDPAGALLELQWQLNLRGHRVLAVERAGSVQPSEQSSAVLLARTARVLTACAEPPLREALSAAAEDVLAPHRGGSTTYDQRRRGPAWRRRVPDLTLAPLVEDGLAALCGARNTDDRARLAAAMERHGVRELLSRPRRVLVVGEDVAASARVEALAARLGESSVVRATPSGSPSDITWADVVVLVGAAWDRAAGLGESPSPVAVDLTTTDVVGALAQHRDARLATHDLCEVLSRADIVLTADEGQRDILLGALAGRSRINADVYDADPTLRSLVTADPSGRVLEAFCREPVRAADWAVPELPSPRASIVAKVWWVVRREGALGLPRRILGRLGRASETRRRQQ